MTIKQQTIAFAAVCQAARFVQQIAREGEIPSELLSVMLASILNTEPADELAPYGDNLANLTVGLETILSQLGQTSKQKDPELTRYIVSILAIERRLAKRPDALAELAKRIDGLNRQLQHFALTDETMLASFASCYVEVISPLTSKIQVAGEPNFLKQRLNQYKIRALLLAGVRAAVLWRQLGGKRRILFFSRGKIEQTTIELLHQIKHQ
jgi:high frequency lysogenization protein